MAQFSHPDFGGMLNGRTGMTMVGDMFIAEGCRIAMRVL